MSIELEKLTILVCSVVALAFGASCSNELTVNPTMTSTIIATTESTTIPSTQPPSSTASIQVAVPTENTFHRPDLKPGQYILYEIDKGDKVSLSALSPYTGETYSLYNSSYPAHFELSPNLSRLAIVKWEKVELIDLETGLTKTIEFDDVCSSAAWSPDEIKLALTCGEIFIVSFSDLRVSQLTDLSTGHSSNFGEVSWSPDGKWLAYNNVADPHADDPYDGIYITDTACLLSPDQCKERTKFLYGLFYQFVASTWSLDSSQLAVLALGNIYRFDVNLIKLDLNIELTHENIWDITGLAWSSDGNQYAISNEATQSISIISSKDGKEAASFPTAGTVLSWIKVP